jgi:hypothetical protein
MNHHAEGGQGWKKKLDRAREAELLARRMVDTCQSYIEQRDTAYRALEAENTLLASRLTAQEARSAALEASPVVVPRPRERLPETRVGCAWTLRIGPLDTGTACTLHVGLYEDGRVGEVFLRFSKAERGGHGASMADFACTMMSIALQYGSPLDELLQKMIGASDDSGGVTRIRRETDDGSEEWGADPEVPMCKSLRDYIGKKLKARFGREDV